MRTPRLIAALLLAVGLAGAHAAPAAAEDDWGKTPGTYTRYSFPADATEFSEVTWGTTVVTDPGFTSHTFWSHQFGFNKGNGAYVGLQDNGGEQQLFLFSVWDTSEARQGTEGSWCQGFGGEGEGMSCRANVPWKQGEAFAFTVRHEGDGWFGATVRNTTTGASFKLGSIRTPASAIKAAGMIDWTEYYEWSMRRTACLSQPYSDAFFALPKAVTTAGKQVTGSIRSMTDNGACSFVKTEAVDGGSKQTLAIGNSVRGAITNKAGLCLDAKGVDYADLEWAEDLTKAEGARSVVDTCHERTDQGWVRATDGTVRLVNEFCLTGNADDTVTITSCGTDPGDSRKWTAGADGTLRNTATGRCLTVPPGNGQAGRAVELANCLANPTQVWTVPATV